MPNWDVSSVVAVVPPLHPRKLAKVPFVELSEGRLQGVVSSGSDIERVYVSAISADTHGFSCSTNNNRPCGGLSSYPCKHLHTLVDEAVLQYGAERVARFLRLDPVDGDADGGDIMGRLNGSAEKGGSATVFSRFLRHLAYLELAVCEEPIAELHWFPSTNLGGR